MTKGRGQWGAQRSSRWPARAALAVLVASSDACTCAVGPPMEPSGPGPDEAAGGAGAAGAGAAGKGAGAAGKGGAPGAGRQPLLPTDCRGKTCAYSRPASLARAHCPTGPSCDIGSGNGRGVYIERQFDYCMVADNISNVTLCPEAFVDEPDGSVSLVLRDPLNPQTTRKLPVNALLISPTGQSSQVAVKSVRAERTELVIRYANAGAQGEARGAALASLQLRTYDSSPSTNFHISMRIEPASTSQEGGVQRYAITYHLVDSNLVVRRHCGGGPGAALGVSFLSGRRVDGLTAAVTLDPTITTMSCESGAIDTCLTWGYAPWSPKAAGTPGAGDYLFATCLQAKRAAYYVGLGDTTSYTAGGTPILRRDPFGILDEPQGKPDGTWEGGIEAIWSPRGAECFNYGNRRRPDRDVPKRSEVPPCSPAQWTATGKIATMPRRPVGAP